jgi:hypothetical protein
MNKLLWCGITVDFIRGVVFLLLYLIGLTNESGEIKGHDSLCFKY